MRAMAERFNNAQLEILSIFADNMSESDLEFLKRVLLRFKAERLMDEADHIWEEKKWTNDDVDKLLQVKMRTPYNRQKA